MWRAIALTALLVGFCGSLTAGEIEITPMFGYRWGGDFEADNTVGALMLFLVQVPILLAVLGHIATKAEGRLAFSRLQFLLLAVLCLAVNNPVSSSRLWVFTAA